MKKKRVHSRTRKDFNEEEFFRFAKSYLSEAFPNPRRIDCPPDAELARLAERPRGVDPFLPGHITSCSPCFNRYMEILADLKRRKSSGDSTHARVIPFRTPRTGS